jgi:transposase-like protein
LCCKKCNSKNYVKAGFINKEQRYLCKDCGCKFVPTRQKGKDDKTKLTAVWLYCHGLSFRTIAKLFNVNVKSVFNWVKDFALQNYIKPDPKTAGESVIILELDEMWHYIKSKKTNAGYGRLIVAIPINSLTGSVEGETLIHLHGS